MIQTVSSTLLLYPEWIIWVVVMFTLINMLLGLITLTYVRGVSHMVLYHFATDSEELEALKIKYRELWTAHEDRRDHLGQVMAETHKLKCRYDELWQEHQDTCTILGSIIPDDPYDVAGTDPKTR